MSSGTFLYPNVSSIPGQSGISSPERGLKKTEGQAGEFDRVFDRTIQKDSTADVVNGGKDLNQVKAPLKFSAHATERIRDRKINLDSQTMARVTEALDKAESKGIDDTLVLTKDAALIVNVKNRTVVTALDRNSAAGNVFTNIDGAVVV